MKIIFLEIHGVLMLPVCEMTARLMQQPLTAFPPAVDALNRIIGLTGARIVITSAWRNAGIDVMTTKMTEWGVKGKVEDITPIGEGKSEEITRYLIWAPKPDAYVIIDPEPVENTRYDKLSEHLVITDRDRGITGEMADVAIEILNGRNE